MVVTKSSVKHLHRNVAALLLKMVWIGSFCGNRFNSTCLFSGEAEEIKG